MKEYDFLTEPTEDRLRREMNNICDSYSHPWDALAELLQNSVDAIRTHIEMHGNSRDHSITVTVDQLKRKISVSDTGVGVAPQLVPGLLAPHGSDKSGKPGLIGEKGVGLTYVIFSSNRFHIDTKSMEGGFVGQIEKAALWREGVADLPKLQGQEVDGATSVAETYTEICAEGIESSEQDDHESIFYMGFPALACVLRTKTAAGSTQENPEPIKVELVLIDRNGKPKKRAIPFQYMYPHELIGKGNWIEYNEDLLGNMALWSDREKSKRLQGKGLLKRGYEERVGRKIRYSAFFVPSRKTWAEINQKNEFITKSEDGETQHLYKAAIEVATKGMPTAVTLDPPLSGKTGYWPNIHILIQDDSLPFDIGRKSIPGRTKGLLNDITRNIFSELTKFAKFMSTDPSVSADQSLADYDKNKRFEDLEKLPDLHIGNIPYLKQPDGQECAVVALFHELAATKYLKGYRVLKTGYKETYDLWGRYQIRDDTVGSNAQVADAHMGSDIPIIIEFKYKLESILEDFENNIKRFGDINLLVCWDIDDAKFADYNVTIGVVTPENALFSGTNFELKLPATFNLGSSGTKPVISLKRYVEDLAKSER